MIIQLCADVLCVPIVALSSAQDMDVSVHFPSKRQLSVSPIIVVYQAEGRGHFDGTLEEDFDELNQSFSRVFEVFVSFLEIATIVKKRNNFLCDLQKSNAAETSISMFFSNFFLSIFSR